MKWSFDINQCSSVFFRISDSSIHSFICLWSLFLCTKQIKIPILNNTIMYGVKKDSPKDDYLNWWSIKKRCEKNTTMKKEISLPISRLSFHDDISRIFSLILFSKWRFIALHIYTKNKNRILVVDEPFFSPHRIVIERTHTNTVYKHVN